MVEQESRQTNIEHFQIEFSLEDAPGTDGWEAMEEELGKAFVGWVAVNIPFTEEGQSKTLRCERVPAVKFPNEEGIYSATEEVHRVVYTKAREIILQKGDLQIAEALRQRIAALSY